MMNPMEFLKEAVALLEKANAKLEPELLAGDAAREMLSQYARAEKLASFGVAALARRTDDATAVSQATGTFLGKAKRTVDTGNVLRDSDDLSGALSSGKISLDQAGEIATTEQACPGSAGELVAMAERESFHVLKERARKVKLETEQHRGLAEGQHEARRASSYIDELGMVHIDLVLEPHKGTPIVNRAESEAASLRRAARNEGPAELFERNRADAYVRLMSGSCAGRPRRPELVVLVSHEVAQRGWTEVKTGELCKIPGVGPVPPEVARRIASDAFLSGLFYDGTDLRHFRRWSRGIPIEVAIALELGGPPGFDGVACADCGNRFRTEFDHVEPHAARGPTSHGNLDPRSGAAIRRRPSGIARSASSRRDHRTMSGALLDHH